MQIIPFNPKVSSRQTCYVSLGKSNVGISIHWNAVSSTWHMSFTKSDGARIYGVPVVPSYPLLRQYRAHGVIDGDILVLPDGPVASTSSVGYNELGSSYMIAYMDASELKAWEEEHGL